MRTVAQGTATVLVALSAFWTPGSAVAADLEWEVESPFRFFKRASSFEAHKKAFLLERGTSGTPPSNIIWRVERRLNDPDCADRSTPDACAASRRGRYEVSRLGWASQTVDAVCYDRGARPRRYPATCDRQYSWGTAKEDYILPPAHTVVVRLSTERLAEAAGGECTWTWRPRSGRGAAETKRQSCKTAFTIPRVPFSLERGQSGAEVKVTLPDGRELVDQNVVVDDMLVVAMGDSFASGESNPDRPVVFSPTRQLVYDPNLLREEMTVSSVTPKPKDAPSFGLASADGNYDPKTLPRRRMEDEERGLMYRLTSREFAQAFNKSSAQWLSADCHRSLYGYPFRVGIQLALEDRHRSITFVSLACSGSEVTEGLFLEKDVRENFNEPKTPAQFDQLADLLCRSGTRSQGVTYSLPTAKAGSTQFSNLEVTKRWCPPQARKRPIDLVLLSIGGNDVGFSALALYGVTESATDLAPIAGWIGREIRYSPSVARAYLGIFDRRMKAVRGALVDGFGVNPARVVQNAYEPIQYDETGQICGLIPTLGMDVHPKLRADRGRIKEVSDFSQELLTKLHCMADGSRKGCPATLATGQGTGFQLVTEHLADFAKRGFCAREPGKASKDGSLMAIPRLSRASQDFEPYSPASTLPYGRRWRLIHTPNDAFLTANLHREGISTFDILQPVYAALYSGAFHPTAEGHATVADRVIQRLRVILDQRDVVQAKPSTTNELRGGLAE